MKNILLVTLALSFLSGAVYAEAERNTPQEVLIKGMRKDRLARAALDEGKSKECTMKVLKSPLLDEKNEMNGNLDIYISCKEEANEQTGGGVYKMISIKGLFLEGNVLINSIEIGRAG